MSHFIAQLCTPEISGTEAACLLMDISRYKPNYSQMRQKDMNRKSTLMFA